jgi:hypothetical protein
MSDKRARLIRDKAARIYGIGLVAFIAAFSALGLLAFFARYLA